MNIFKDISSAPKVKKEKNTLIITLKKNLKSTSNVTYFKSILKVNKIIYSL